MAKQLVKRRCGHGAVVFTFFGGVLSAYLLDYGLLGVFHNRFVVHFVDVVGNVIYFFSHLLCIRFG